MTLFLFKISISNCCIPSLYKNDTVLYYKDSKNQSKNIWSNDVKQNMCEKQLYENTMVDIRMNNMSMHMQRIKGNAGKFYRTLKDTDYILSLYQGYLKYVLQTYINSSKGLIYIGDKSNMFEYNIEYLLINHQTYENRITVWLMNMQNETISLDLSCVKLS